MPLAHDLLEQARHLANREPQRPKQASLRRAVSTAYYALFHLLISAAAAGWRNWRQRALFARAFEHGVMKAACTATKDKQFPNPAPPGIDQLKRLADIFLKLQQQRHMADYDNSKRWTRSEALVQIEAAHEAFEKWDEIRNQPVAEDFLLQLLIAGKVRRF